MVPIGRLAIIGAAAAATFSLFTQFGPVVPPGGYIPTSGQPGKDVIWVPTPQALVDRMLDMAEVTKEDYLVDLGSGDGRTVIAAAKQGVRAHGIEYNPDLVALSQRKAQAESVAQLATFEHADIFETDFSDATVVTLFLLPELNLRLRPKLLAMTPGTRIVSNSFDMGEWKPDERIEAGGDCTKWCRAFKWTVPANVEGKWRFGDDRLELAQSFQMLSGTLTQGGRSFPLTNARLDGASITFAAGNQLYAGSVAEDRMSGSSADGSWTAVREAG